MNLESEEVLSLRKEPVCLVLSDRENYIAIVFPDVF